MNLSEKQLRIISETAAEQAIKAYREDENKRQVEKHDRRLRNIRLLLKNYRALVLHSENLKEEISEFEDTSIQSLDLYSISLESIESIMKSQKKTIAMVQFVNNKIEAYKKSCSPHELKFYRVLELRYISPKKHTIQEIAERENIDRTTVSRYLNKAVEDLLVIIFGIESLHFEK